MNKLEHITQIVETYEVTDPKTHGEFSVRVTEGIKGIYFEFNHSRVMSSDGIDQCIKLLEQLVQRDHMSPIIRKGEKKAKEESAVVATHTNPDLSIGIMHGLNKKSPYKKSP